MLLSSSDFQSNLGTLCDHYWPDLIGLRVCSTFLFMNLNLTQPQKGVNPTKNFLPQKNMAAGLLALLLLLASAGQFTANANLLDPSTIFSSSCNAAPTVAASEKGKETGSSAKSALKYRTVMKVVVCRALTIFSSMASIRTLICLPLVFGSSTQNLSFRMGPSNVFKIRDWLA